MLLKRGQLLSRDIADYPDGIVVVIDKPYRWTSADVVRKVKFAASRHFGKKKLKVGHAGTLDPLATGVLIVCIGAATKKAELYQSHDKEYLAGISFGATTPSYDLEKEPDRTFPYGHIDAEAVNAVLPQFLGTQMQVAPLFSAKSVDGVRAYELARKVFRQGGDLDESARGLLHTAQIRIDELELVSFNRTGAVKRSIPEDCGKSARINVADTSALHLPCAQIRVVCSKGTYIRALARDLGEALDSGAHLCSLRRTRSGEFGIEDALDIREVVGTIFQSAHNTL